MEDYSSYHRTREESEDLRASLARIDERTEWMVKKLQDHCDWKAVASIDIATLKEAKLPERMSKLENWRWYIGGALALLCILISGRYVIGPTNWP